MKYDSVFFINSCVNIPRGPLSIYDETERFEQTVESIESVKKWAPNAKIFLFDSGINHLTEEQLTKIIKMDVIFHYTGYNESMKKMTEYGQKNYAETYSFILFLNWLYKSNQMVETDRVYKLSGRYKLNENFDYSFRPKDSFVFKKSVDSWMSTEQLNRTGASKVYDTRLWHMDYTLLNTFNEELVNIFNDSYSLGIDVEHSFYKHLHKYKVSELEIVGVEGYKAPNGEYVNE